MCWATRSPFLEKSISTLPSHDGYGKQWFGMLAKKIKMEEIAKVIFMDGNPSSNSKNLRENLRI